MNFNNIGRNASKCISTFVSVLYICNYFLVLKFLSHQKVFSNIFPLFGVVWNRMLMVQKSCLLYKFKIIPPTLAENLSSHHSLHLPDCLSCCTCEIFRSTLSTFEFKSSFLFCILVFACIPDIFHFLLHIYYFTVM